MKLDHVIVAVRDLDAAAVRFESILGLPVAVWSKHPRGTRNALFIFEQGPYLELLTTWAAPETGSSARSVYAFLEQREGLFGLALAPDDITQAVARLRRCGYEVADPVPNSGVNADGRTREWRGAFAPSVAGDHSFLVEHLGWDWRTDLRPEPPPSRATTAVRSIHHVAFDVEDAEAASRSWDQWFGLPLTQQLTSERMGARVLIHRAGDATVEFVSATTADGPVAQRIARRGYGLFGLAFQVANLDGAVAAVRSASVEIGEPTGGVLSGGRVARIAPASAYGVEAQYLHFT
jgi:catechol 2,3-dioxygenase-like lactoylglutathione lyase family enzyme